MAALPQGGSRAAKHWGTGSLSCLSVGCDINTQKWLTLRTHPSPVFISEQDFWVGTDHEVYLMIRKEGVGVCVCVQNLVQLLSICPLFIIPPFSPFCQTFSPPHYGKTFLSLSYPLCRHSLSSVLCRPHVYISFVSSPAFFLPILPDATVTFACCRLAQGLLLWSLATTACSYPLKFIYPIIYNYHQSL